MQLRYSISGQGQPLIFIHGAFVDAEIWQHQLEFFAQHCKVIAVDLRGHGGSPGSTLKEYHVKTFAYDILALMDELNIPRATFCGLSMGAMIAQYIGGNFPQRTDALILVGATASLRLNLPEKIITTFLFPKWVAMMLFGLMSTSQFMRISFLMTWFTFGNKWLGSQSTRRQIRKSMSRVHSSELKKVYAAVHTFRAQAIENGTYPVLLIRGAKDSKVVRRHNRHLAKLCGIRATQIEVAEAGHACNHDQPIAFNHSVRQWMQSNAGNSFSLADEKDYTSGYSKWRELHHAS